MVECIDLLGEVVQPVLRVLQRVGCRRDPRALHYWRGTTSFAAVATSLMVQHPLHGPLLPLMVIGRRGVRWEGG